MFLAYASAAGHALIDRELYLPKEWTGDAARCAAAGIPETTAFATKPALALRMIERAVKAGVPFRWVLGDEVYGNDRLLRMGLEQQHLPHVLAVRRTEPLWALADGSGPRQVPAQDLAAAIPDQDWHRLSAGAGAKGERLYDWARVRLFRLQSPPWDHWLLIRRSLAQPGDMAFYVVFAPADTTLDTLARVAGRRWTIEECFEIAKQAVGLDQYEVRSWQGWYRHITLAMLAFDLLVVLRQRCAQAEKGGAAPARTLRAVSAWVKSAPSSPASRPASPQLCRPSSPGPSGAVSTKPSPGNVTGSGPPPDRPA